MPITLEIKNTGTETLTIEPDQTIEVQVIVSDPPPSEGTLSDALTAWSTAHAGDNVPVGGPPSFIPGTAFFNGGSAGRTLVANTPKHFIRQHCYINSFQYNAYTVTAGGWKFKIFRPDGSGGFTLVGESQAFTPPGTGVQTLNVTTPIGPCQPGDCVGLYLPVHTEVLRVSAESGADCLFKSGDLSTVSGASSGGEYFLDIQAFCPAPFLAIMGDSIACNHGSPIYRPFLDAGISGDPAGEPASYLRTAFPALSYQNFAKGGTTWAFAAANIALVAAVMPKAVICHYGINDVVAGRTWTAISADMDAVKAGLPSGTKLFISEVLPNTSGTDTEAAAVRALNANYATWCAANGATLIPCHDAMAQTRTSTGQLDDLIPAYSYDNLHPSVPDGVSKLADLWAETLDAYEWAA